MVRARAEEHAEQYDVVVARAVAPLSRLVGWCTPLRRTDGVILAIKGRSAAEEVGRAGPVLARPGLTVGQLTVAAHPTLEPATVVRLGPSD